MRVTLDFIKEPLPPGKKPFWVFAVSTGSDIRTTGRANTFAEAAEMVKEVLEWPDLDEGVQL